MIWALLHRYFDEYSVDDLGSSSYIFGKVLSRWFGFPAPTYIFLWVFSQQSNYLHLLAYFYEHSVGDLSSPGPTCIFLWVFSRWFGFPCTYLHISMSIQSVIWVLLPTLHIFMSIQLTIYLPTYFYEYSVGDLGSTKPTYLLSQIYLAWRCNKRTTLSGRRGRGPIWGSALI